MHTKLAIAIAYRGPVERASEWLAQLLYMHAHAIFPGICKHYYDRINNKIY